METKICITCKVEKSINDFGIIMKNIDGHRNQCKLCRNQLNDVQKELQKQYKQKYYILNHEMLKNKSKKYYDINKEKIKSKSKKYDILYYQQNKEKINKRQKIYYNANKEKRKDYEIKNKSLINKKANEYQKNRKKHDILFKLQSNLRTLICESFRRTKLNKNSKTEKILGCSYEEFKLHLESKFEPWMNWENRGLYNGEPNYGWDIDHIIPQSFAKTEEELLKLNHYTNLQPLCSKVNRYIKRYSNI